MSRVLLFASIVLSAVVAFGEGPSRASESTVTVDELLPHSVGGWGLSFADRDPAVKPGEDFYLSQNGAWLKRTEIKPDKFADTYWLDLKTLGPARLRAVLEQVSKDKNASADSPEGKAGAFYRAWMDTDRVEALGISPLKPEQDAIRAANTKLKMARLMGVAAGPGSMRSVNAPIAPPSRSIFSLTIQQDQKDPGRYVLMIGQSGLELPAPDYYTDKKYSDLKNAYQQYIGKVLTLLGWENSEKYARDIVDFETRIAEGSWSLEQMQDPAKTYNPTSIEGLYKLAPGFNWREFLKGAELSRVDHVAIDARSAFPRIAAVYSETSIDILQARAAFALADERAWLLSSSLEQANFEFRNALINGGAVKHPLRWRRGVMTVLELGIGEILGQLYVDHYFSPESKTKGLEIVTNLKRAIDIRFQNSPWMTAATKQLAREKLAKMDVKLGYPDKFRDYAGLTITDTDLYGDFDRSITYEWRRWVRRINSPFNRTEWLFTPQQANYNYIPTTNSVESPAATMEPPFFDLKADDAVNYGAMGSLLGMSMMQGFSDAGRHFDADGRLRDWWTASDAEKFEAMTKKLVAQYSAVEPLPGVHLNGNLVLNESLSDIGGLLAALDAYHLSLNGQPAPVIDGFTGDQRFFLGWAQMWRAKFRPSFIRFQTATGQNAPPFQRVNGPLRNIDAWYQAFDIKPSDKMYLTPEDRVRIW